MNQYQPSRTQWESGNVVYAVVDKDTTELVRVSTLLQRVSVSGDSTEARYTFAGPEVMVIVDAGITTEDNGIAFQESQFGSRSTIFGLHDGYSVLTVNGVSSLCDGSNPFAQKRIATKYCETLPPDQDKWEWRRLDHETLINDEGKIGMLNALRQRKMQTLKFR
ncbi:hypothetical protein N1030_05535 [Desulfovibrio mangrovi]|uniref:hypothetical protein n=1 Tax=Desulfovibrio mangrovi TaxID=2976983 RepID=UPI0022457BBF|nr:hypothetical protein [Desulfovibrio mangrovi]UZP68437.1 hypothetical protein N1030_05535 [Desulfovibrio mangrovi]